VILDRPAFRVQLRDVLLDARAQRPECLGEVGDAVALHLGQRGDLLDAGHLQYDVRLGVEADQRDVREVGDPRTHDQFVV
jgi:hypothetical protein